MNGKPVNNAILDQFDKQRSRGTEGFGLFDGQFMNMVRSSKEDKILQWLCNYDSNLIMFHHRFPTSTINVKRAAHPLSTYKYFGDTQYVLVHNGVISNSDELFEDHQELGIEYHTLLKDMTYNDSEALLWDLALTLEGKQPEMKCRGYLAFIVLKIVDGELNSMHFGRHGAPLKVWKETGKDGTLELSSAGRGLDVPEDKLHTWNYKTKRISVRDMVFIKPYDYSNYNWSTNYNQSNGTYDGTYDAYGDMIDEDDEVFFIRHGYYPGHYRYTEPKVEVVKEVVKPTPGSWLGPALTRKFAEFLSTKTVDDDKDFKVDAVTDDKELFMPTTAEVLSMALDYLIEADGVFEDAYWIIESDYSEVIDEVKTVEIFRKQLLMEAAMEYIEKDEEYKNKSSVSSMWSAICQQQNLVV